MYVLETSTAKQMVFIWNHGSHMVEIPILAIIILTHWGGVTHICVGN